MKQKRETLPISDAASISRRYFVAVVIIVVIIITVIAFLLSLYFKPQPSDETPWQYLFAQQILIPLGTSISASIIFYLFYSRTAEEKVLREVSTQVTLYAAEYATSLFQKRFDKMMPSKIYPETEVPNKEFNSDFDSFLEQSKTYKYKGDAASYTVFRLHMLSQKRSILEKDIHLLLLDPREKALIENRVQIELATTPHTKLELAQGIDEMREKIYITLITLFDICHSIRVLVNFHTELLFYRTEILDGGLFLTYYLGGEFPSTYLYLRGTLSYDAFLLNFWQNARFSKYSITFTSQMTEEELEKHLRELGCTSNLAELRLKQTAYLEKHKKQFESMS